MSTSTKQLQRKIGPYSIGELLGKGAMGCVFKGMHVDTGLIVAIKQVAIQNLKDEQLKQIQSEISLLKRLNHDHIVKYIDYIQTETHLNIILEFVEGSLATIVKRFGSFAENLVANYIKQVLIGLDYLHSQGVVHRDIKGANILTTKEGKIKLADFGVATRLTEDEKAQSFVGTPYWMAPELIEMRGHISSACDIWSLGCTVIELLTGQPPYHDLYQYPALFRIVQDDHPPLPEQSSQNCQDFLMLCFQKDPNLRSDAKTLLKHIWIKQLIQDQIQIQDQNENLYEDKLNDSKYEFSVYGQTSFIQQNNSKKVSKINKDIQVFCEKIQNYQSLQSQELVQYINQLLDYIKQIPEYKFFIIKNYGLSVFTEILDEFITDKLYYQLVINILQMINMMIEQEGNQKLLETILLFGLLPYILMFCQSQYPKEIRVEAAYFVGQMFYFSTQTQNTLIASGGIQAIIEMLDPDYFQNKDLIVVAINCVQQLFTHKLMSTLNLCKILLKFDILHRLVIILDQINQDLEDMENLNKILQILLFFSESEDKKIKVKMCEDEIIQLIIQFLNVYKQIPDQLQMVIKIIHNIVNEPIVLNILENSGLIPKVVQFLQLNLSQISMQNLLKITYLLGKLSPPRQEQFVLNGIVTILVQLSQNQNYSGLCLAILAQCLQTSSITREKIWENKGPDIFLTRYQDILQNYKLLDAISIWMEFDKSKFEVYFQTNIDKLVKIIRFSNKQEFQQLIPIFLKLILNLEILSEQLSKSDIFIKEIIHRLQINQQDPPSAIVRKEILEILLILCVKTQRTFELIQKHNLNEIVYKMLQIARSEKMVIVEEISSRLLEIFQQ